MARPDFEQLCKTAEYIGLNEVQVECRYYRLGEVSIEALQRELVCRGYASETEVEITWRPRRRS